MVAASLNKVLRTSSSHQRNTWDQILEKLVSYFLASRETKISENLTYKVPLRMYIQTVNLHMEIGIQIHIMGSCTPKYPFRFTNLRFAHMFLGHSLCKVGFLSAR